VAPILVLVLSGGLGLLADTKPKPSPSPSQPPAPPLEASLVKGLKARSIGPAVMGGRVSDIALDPQNPWRFYIGFATGGLVKTSNNGATFQNLMEKEDVASIGAVAVAPSDPNVLYVGTGEANDRNSSSWGKGVYRSGDGGGTFTSAGLKDSKTIARIVVSPKDPMTAYAAAMGDLWGPSSERGLFKTTDGGKNWKAVLVAESPFGNRVGCGDVVMDPQDPNVLYATLYARKRTPWSFVSGPDATDGRDLGGIFKTTDGGQTWKKLAGGLPRATGRIGLSVSQKNPKTVYAVVQSFAGGTNDLFDITSKAGGVFRTEDGGETWTRRSNLDPRPFYFSQIRVDPQNDQKVYVLGFMLHVSEDGGTTFREDRFKKVHPDCHAFVIDPRDSRRLFLGNDGGAFQSTDTGETWDHMSRVPAGEYYRIAVDDSVPYRICGGLQDNSNFLGPSMTRSKDGIENANWLNLGGGDGFWCAFDDQTKDIVYSESQGGDLTRTNLASGEIKALRPAPAEGSTAFRFDWNSPLIPSANEKGVLYLGGNHVFRLTEQGSKWESISPDLSTRDYDKTQTVGSGAETYGVVYALAEAPGKAGMIWAGTDDGKIWLTEDGGKNWADLTSGLPGAIKGQWLSRIEPSHADPAVAYLAVDAHRSQNYQPLAFRTADRGKTWQSIAGDLPADHPVKVVREDPKNPQVLYAGTEFGLFLSVDRGAHWVRFGEIPTVAVDDIVVHPREFDLVVATHGRSLFVIDDVSPIAGLTKEVLGGEAHLFPPRKAYGFEPLPGFADSTGGGIYRGENPPEGALLTYFLKSYSPDPPKIAITNAEGVPVANLTGSGAAGLTRLSWDLKPTKDVLTQYGGQGAKPVRAGEYTVTLTVGKTKVSQKLAVEIAPGLETR
jgi:photosystem II stability/assembly factor-like uncharacterized protein